MQRLKKQQRSLFRPSADERDSFDVQVRVKATRRTDRQAWIFQSNASRLPSGIENPSDSYICRSQSAQPTVNEKTPLS